jgi:hypothetical protein
MRERQKLESAIASVTKLQTDLADALGLIEMAEAENDAAMVADAENALKALGQRAEQMRLQSMLSGEADGKTPIWKSMPAPAAPKARTGPRCCFACTCAGPRSTTTSCS